MDGIYAACSGDLHWIHARFRIEGCVQLDLVPTIFSLMDASPINPQLSTCHTSFSDTPQPPPVSTLLYYIILHFLLCISLLYMLCI